MGSPPRQADDPTSPPCVAAIFDGDNGGATSTGVTATEIRVAVPLSDPGRQQTYELLFEYFNQRYEFYGRRLVPVFVSSAIDDPATARAAAADMASKSIFGALTGTAEWDKGMGLDAMFGELARQKVVTVTRGAGQWISDRTTYDQYHPYLWSVFPSAEQLNRNLANFACSSLVGHPARHLHDADRSQKTRVFGVVTSARYRRPVVAPLVEALERCGGEVHRFDVLTSSGNSSTAITTGLASFDASGVTTVFCICEGLDIRGLHSQVDGRFEWVLTTNSSISPDGDWRSAASELAQTPLFGLMEWPRILPYQATPWYQALLTMRPDVAPGTASTTEEFYLKGTTPTAYPPLAVLAAGIQGAGPQLTPENFAQALQSMKFPNAGAGAAPFWQPTVGFGPGDHSFYSDYAVAWWNPTLAGESYRGLPAVGSFCFLDRGARYSEGSFPTDIDARLFDPAAPCR